MRQRRSTLVGDRAGLARTLSVVVLVLWLASPAPVVVEARRFFGARRGTSLKASLLTKSRLAVKPYYDATELTFSPASLARFARGGSTKAADGADDEKKDQKKKDDLHAYRLQQQLYLQSRSLQLRQALIQRGFTELQHSEMDQNTPKAVDWDCAVATADHPKSCLYSFDAQINSKVIAPVDTTQWITLGALNRLRRNDPTKVEPLWHSQYHILKTWFHPNNSPFSLYTHLSPAGTLLSCLLDAPFLLASSMLLVLGLTVLVTLPLWEGLLKVILMSPVLWMQWHQWGRFVHAALPLKLLLGQLAWKGMAAVFGQVYQRARGRLVELECQIMEQCIPLTVLEGDAAAAAANKDPSASVSSSLLDEEVDDEEIFGSEEEGGEESEVEEDDEDEFEDEDED